MDAPLWTGYGSFAFVVFLAVGVAYALGNTAFAFAHGDVASVTYSAVDVPILVAVLLGLTASARTPRGATPPSLDLALGTAVGYLAYVGVLAAVALPVFGFFQVAQAPAVGVVTALAVVLAASLVAWAADEFAFVDGRP